MPEGLGPMLNNVGVVGGCLLLVWLFVRDWIVSGARLRRAEAERDRWQNIALEAIAASRTAIVPAAEAVHALVTRLPDPGAKSRPEDGSP